jgi:hypothetical protein
MGTDVCGKVKKSYKGLPRFKKVRQRGEIESKHRGHVMALRWRGNWDVFMLTCFHNSQDEGHKSRAAQVQCFKYETFMFIGIS